MFFEFSLIHLVNIFVGCSTADGILFCASLDDFYSIPEQKYITNLTVVGGTGKYLPLKEFSFKNYSNLTTLTIKNSIHTIEIGAFDGLDNIEDLKFENNDFLVLKTKVFDIVATSLTILNCNVREIQPGALKNIRNIYLRGNSIAIIKREVFSNTLTSGLQLSQNKIKYIEHGSFKGMENLRYLDLSNNNLKHFNASAILGEAPQLKLLDLSYNQIKQIGRPMFSVTPNLEVLLVANNLIKKIGYTAFVDLKNIELVNVSHNYITELHSNLFNTESNLKHLFLHNNNLTYLSSGFMLKLNKLKNISLSNNFWQCSCKHEINMWLEKNKINNVCDSDSSCVENSEKCTYSVAKSKFIKLENILCVPYNWRVFKNYDDF